MQTWVVFAIAIFGYSAILAVVGSLGYKKSMSVNVEEYFLAGRTIGPVIAFFTLAATGLSSFALLGVPGYYFAHGIGTLYMIQLCLICPFLWWLFAPKLSRLSREFGYITVGDYMADRYSPAMRLASSAILTLITIPYISMQVMGFGYTLAGLTGGRINYAVGAIILGSMMVIYVMTAGFRGVAWTDVIQGAVMLLAMVLAAGILVSRMYGGLGGLFTAMAATRPDLLTVPGPKGMWSQISWFSWFVFMMGFVAQPQVIARFFAVRNDNALRFSLVGYALFGVIIYSAAMIIGFTGALNLPGGFGPADQVSTAVAGNYLPPVLGILLACGIIGAAKSTADSQYLAVSTILARDFYEKTRNRKVDSAQIVKLGRWWILGLFVLGLVIALLQVQTLIGMIVTAVFPFGAQVFIPLVAGLHWRRATKEGALAGVAAGVVVAAWLLFIAKAAPLGLHATAWAAIANVVFLVGVSLVTPRPQPEMIERLHAV